MASKRKAKLANGTLACGIALALPAAPALAEPRAINIPSEEAAKSIPEFARQENIQIIAPVSQLHGIKTQAVSGRMELDEALKTLLVGTGLEVASNDGATIVLRRALVLPASADSDLSFALAPSETIIVTGSRVISDAANSPTPLTIVSSRQLQNTTPSNLADGLNKLPIFQGSQIIGRPGDGSQNFSSNVLNLRNFGVQRTLVLLDGHRAPPSNSDGTVDIDTLPQMLVSRIDIVTGGASGLGLAVARRIIAEGGYQEIDGREIATGLNAMIDGLWFDCLIDPKAFNRAEAKRVCRTYLASVFPAHFAGGAMPEGGRRPRSEGDSALGMALDQSTQGRDAHRARLAAALRRRLEPVGPLRREVLAASVGVSVKTLESWLDGRGEPSSWQMGRLIPATDAQLWFEVYGPVHEEAQRLYDARLAQQQEQALRERAALQALRAAPAAPSGGTTEPE